MEALVFLTLVVPFLFLFYGAFLLSIRPTKPVLLQSLLGGLVLGVINFVVDSIAYYAHWWHYEFLNISVKQATAPYQRFVVDSFAWIMNVLHVPFPFYLTPIFIYGSLIYLLIWRYRNGKGRWFSLLLLFGTPVFCIVRDLIGAAQKSSYQVWDNTPIAILVTILMWPIAFYLGYLVFQRVAAVQPYEYEDQQTPQRLGQKVQSSK